MVFFPYRCIILKRTKVSLPFVLAVLYSGSVTEMVSTLESFLVSLYGFLFMLFCFFCSGLAELGFVRCTPKSR